MDILRFMAFVKIYDTENDIIQLHREKSQAFAANQIGDVRTNLRQVQDVRESYIHNPERPMLVSKVKCIDSLALDLAEHQTSTGVSAHLGAKEAALLSKAYLNILTGLLERESLVTTGIGYGVATPLAKIDSPECCSKLMTGLYVLKQEMDWGAIDNRPVNICVAIIAPREAVGAHLNVLATYSSILKNEETRYNIIHSQSVDEIKEVLKAAST